MNLSKLAEEIVNGRRLTPKDDLIFFFVTCDLSELTAGADYIRKQLVGDKVDLCTMNYKSLADKVRYYKATEKGQEAMNEKLIELWNEKLNQDHINIFSNMLKKGIQKQDIKDILKLSDADFNIMYPLALKYAQ